MLPKDNPRGGKDENNDCLYNALKKAFPFQVGFRGNKKVNGKYKSGFHRISPAELKTQLNLGRSEPIHYKRIPEVEDLLKIRIHLTGDFSYTSGKSYDPLANVSLTNGHYEFISPESQKDLMCIPTKESVRLLTYWKNGESNYVLFDGTSRHTESRLQTDIKTKSLWKVSVEEDLEPTWRRIHDNAEALSQETGGYMDISKYGYRPSYYVKHYFSKFSKLFPAEPLGRKEAEWISKASGGGLNWANNDTKLEKAYQYDINSFYPSMLKS